MSVPEPLADSEQPAREVAVAPGGEKEYDDEGQDRVLGEPREEQKQPEPSHHPILAWRRSISRPQENLGKLSLACLMRTPLKPLPEAVARWTRRARWLRWLDALAAWLALWAAVALVVRGMDGVAQAVLAVLLTVGGAFVPMLRVRWRPATASVALVVGRPLRPGHRAWHVRPGEAELVLVTARRRVRVVIASPTQGPVEGVPVRLTQALLIPADPVGPR